MHEDCVLKLGDRVRDVVTGFEGVITARVEYINGCLQFCVQPKAKDDKIPDAYYVDWKRLESVGPGVSLASLADDTGGIMSDRPPTQHRP